MIFLGLTVPWRFFWAIFCYCVLIGASVFAILIHNYCLLFLCAAGIWATRRTGQAYRDQRELERLLEGRPGWRRR